LYRKRADNANLTAKPVGLTPKDKEKPL